MPWSAKTLLVLGVTIMVPFIGEYVAVAVVFAASLPLGLPVPLVMGICRALGLLQYWTGIYVALIAVAALAFAAFFARRLRSRSSSQQQRAYYLNALILSLGLPVLVAISFIRVHGLFHAGGV